MITAEQYRQFQQDLGSIQWTPKDGGGFTRTGCDPPFVSYYLGTGGADEGYSLFDLLHERQGFADLHGQILPGMSPAQGQIALDQITDAISCYREEGTHQIEELPPSVPAHGFILDDDFSVLAVTNPRGGLAWMLLRDGLVTHEIVRELAEVASAFLAEAIS